MFTTIATFLLGLLSGGLLVYVLLRAKHATAQASARADSATEVAALQTRLQLADQRVGQETATQLDLKQGLLRAQAALADERVRTGKAEVLAAQVPKLETELTERAEQIAHLNRETLNFSVSVQRLETTLDQERRQSQEKLQLLLDAKEALSNQFKTLATEIFEEKSVKFTEQNKTNLNTLLNPLSERIKTFEKQVADTYDKDSKERLTLETEVKRLITLNADLNQEARNLTNALTGGNQKAQGTWGEMVLETVLESSGLRKGHEYDVQVADILQTEEGNRRHQPDVVVNLPDGKHLVVDSKVSLNAYVRFTAATEDSVRASELKLHIAAIRSHIRVLSGKRYHDLYNLKTLDFVFLFIPVEPAFLTAFQQDSALFLEAFEQRIVVVGPSTLLATLRTVQSIWRLEHQNQNALEIARQSGQMYDKFVNFVEDLSKLGKQIETARETYGQAMNKLKDGTGNLLGRADKLKKLGAKTSKALPTVLLAEGTEDVEPDAE